METTQGIMYMQLRYHTASDANTYEGLTIIINRLGTARQSVQDLTEAGKRNINNSWIISDQQEFRTILEQKILAHDWQTTYDNFLKEWEKYFILKNRSVETTRKLYQQFNWDYYEMLENEYQSNGVYEQKTRLSQLENAISKMNSPSLEDIFREARQDASMAYTRSK